MNGPRDHVPRKLTHLRQRVQRCLEAGKLIYSAHALQRMEEEGITHMEVRQVLRRGRHKADGDQYDDIHRAWNYRFEGFTIGGERKLRIVISFIEEQEIVVVTAFDPSP